MRVFLGIQIPKFVKKMFWERISKLNLKGNIYESENYHITLNFIGNIDEILIDDIAEICKDVASKRDLFEVCIGGLNYFVKKNKKILWIDNVEGKEYLKDLYDDLSVGLSKLGLEYTDQYIPHMTIARNVNIEECEIEELDRKITDIKSCFKVERITIFESKRVEGVLRYIPIREIKLS